MLSRRQEQDWPRLLHFKPAGGYKQFLESKQISKQNPLHCANIWVEAGVDDKILGVGLDHLEDHDGHDGDGDNDDDGDNDGDVDYDGDGDNGLDYLDDGVH